MSTTEPERIAWVEGEPRLRSERCKEGGEKEGIDTGACLQHNTGSPGAACFKCFTRRTGRDLQWIVYW